MTRSILFMAIFAFSNFAWAQVRIDMEGLDTEGHACSVSVLFDGDQIVSTRVDGWFTHSRPDADAREAPVRRESFFAIQVQGSDEYVVTEADMRGRRLSIGLSTANDSHLHRHIRLNLNFAKKILRYNHDVYFRPSLKAHRSSLECRELQSKKAN